MGSSGRRQVQGMLQAAVQSVQWTYSLFWQLCPQQRVLMWSDGYYNGAIKTRKTVQPAEATAEEAALQRSQELRDLYETLLAGESTSNNQHQPPTKRASAALSPEDLTESEWFYLMCVSFSFPPASGLPGKAYARRQHIWLSGANEVDSKTFSRAILAKSAKIQTVVCIPLLDGVVELGTTDKMEEDLGFIYHIKSFFNDHPQPSKPALSEHSASNPSSTSLPPIITYTEPFVDEADDEEEDDDDDYGGATAEPSKLMQLDALSEDVQFPSPEEVSNNLDSDFHMLAVSSSATAGLPAGKPWQDHLNTTSLQPHTIELPVSVENDDSNYSETVRRILKAQRSDSLSTLAYSSTQSSFATWTSNDAHVDSRPRCVENGASQCVLKCIIFTVPFFHAKHHGESARAPPTSQPRGTETAAQDEHSANHVVAERRRREKLNERFVTLRSMVPFVTKMDKVSILGDAIEYVKQLRKRIQDLEAHNRQIEMEKHQQKRMRPCRPRTRPSASDCGGGGKKAAAVVEVSIIERDALLEMRCEHREGLLIDVLQLLRELRIETTAVQTAVNGGAFTAEIRAKVMDHFRGKKVSIVEVKRAIHQILP